MHRMSLASERLSQRLDKILHGVLTLLREYIGTNQHATNPWKPMHAQRSRVLTFQQAGSAASAPAPRVG